MLHYLILAYIAIYTLGMLALFVASIFVVEPEDRDPPLETAFDIVLSLGLLAGMLMYAFEVDVPSLQSAWKLVSVSLVVMLIISNVRGRKRSLEEEPDADGDAVAWTDTLTLLLLLPSAVINLIFAFG